MLRNFIAPDSEINECVISVIYQEREKSDFRELFKNGMLTYLEPKTLRHQVGIRDELNPLRLYQITGSF